MSTDRPDPDDLLARFKAGERTARRGRLKIYFGYAAGVGKTFSMLEDARREVSSGCDLVAGYVEPHGRAETEALLQGIETIPFRAVDYRGVSLREFDVDAVLQRRPEIVLVDELAHTNVPGSRHEKRWQDVEDLLAAGIDVWSTLNVQHIESLNDVIGGVTGVIVRETVPDRIFDLADELKLVDITPSALVQRLEAGKVYVNEQAKRAIGSFFRKSNLNALRELSFRQAARRIHSDVETVRRETSTRTTWATAERLLVCVGPSPTTSRVIRTAKRMSTALDAAWVAVTVDRTGESNSSPNSQSVAQHFRLAERLGAETVTLVGQNVTDTILEYARSRNVTKIFIGRTDQPRWRRSLFGTIVDDLLDRSGDIDIYVIHGESSVRRGFFERLRWEKSGNLSYLRAAVVVTLICCIASFFRSIRFADSEANTVMVFLAAVAWVAYREGRGPAVLASLLAVLSFDFFFVPPIHTFVFADAQYAVTFLVMLSIGLVISSLTSRLRAQVESARFRERRISTLYELGKSLSAVYGKVFIVNSAVERIEELVGGKTAVYLVQEDGEPELVVDRSSLIGASPVSSAAARWVIEHDRIAGAGTNTLPNAPALFIPLSGSIRTMGAIAVRVEDPQGLLDPEIRQLLDACARLLAMAIERDQMTLDAADSRIQAEAEQVRSSLLSSVSHDLKTPLAAIAGACDSLLESDTIEPATRRQLLETASEEARRLNRLLDNILQMSKLEAGAAQPKCQWHVLEEIVGSAIRRTRVVLGNRKVSVSLPEKLPLVYVDDLLLEQLFVNLFENVANHTPEDSAVSIRAELDPKHLRIVIADNGPGLPSGASERIFEKFYRGTPGTDDGRGSGLGLAICRAIVQAHRGTIQAFDRSGGGAEFVIRLPIRDDAPQISID